MTPRIWSQALTETRWWLTGQMPQIRSVICGISKNIRPSQNFSNPRNSFTWKKARWTLLSSPRWTTTLACPSIRVTGSITIFRTMIQLLICVNANPSTCRGAWAAAFDQFAEHVVDRIGRRRAARQIDVDRDDLIQRPDLLHHGQVRMLRNLPSTVLSLST